MGTTVNVACKLPMGLILELPGRPQVVVKGFSTPVGLAPAHLIVGGYAITPHIDAEFFEAWMAANATLSVVKAGLIFGYAKQDSAEGVARERAAEKCGLEPADPDKPGSGLERVQA
jgi:hypothetical protein